MNERLKYLDIIGHHGEYLTDEERKKYLSELTLKQQRALQEYKRYNFNSKIMTDINQEGVYWQLENERIYYDFDIHHPQNSPLQCECGLHVKYLYMCKDSKVRETGFGQTHLAQEAGIQMKVIRQINKLHHQIDRGTDVILSLYHGGMRFPKEDYQLAQKYNLLSGLDAKKQSMFEVFNQLDMPLYFEDYQLLDSLTKPKRDELERKRAEIEREKRARELIKHQAEEERERQRQQKIYEANCQKREREELRRNNDLLSGSFQDLMDSFNLQDDDNLLQKPKPVKDFDDDLPISQLQEFRNRHEQQMGYQFQLKNDIQNTWKRVFAGHEDIIKRTFLNYMHYKLACYVMFNDGNFHRGSVLRTPKEIKQRMQEILSTNVSVHDAVLEDDPHLIETLACAKDGKILGNALLKAGLIIINNQNQIVYVGNNQGLF